MAVVSHGDPVTVRAQLVVEGGDADAAARVRAAQGHRERNTQGEEEGKRTSSHLLISPWRSKLEETQAARQIRLVDLDRGAQSGRGRAPVRGLRTCVYIVRTMRKRETPEAGPATPAGDGARGGRDGEGPTPGWRPPALLLYRGEDGEGGAPGGRPGDPRRGRAARAQEMGGPRI